MQFVPEQAVSPELGTHRVFCFALEVMTFICETLATSLGPYISKGGEDKT